jgi:mannose/fructose/N-acetylgalactosamine-specific phosphotransferase system component IIC
MAKVKYITSTNEIPVGQKCMLVVYGQEYAQTRNGFGVTIMVARQQSKTVSELSFLTAVHTAKGIAKQEGMSGIFVCTATTPWPTSTIPHPPAGRTSPA